MENESRKKKWTVGTIIALIVFIVSAFLIAGYFIKPITKDMQVRTEMEKEQMSLRDKYRENTDMAGWIQVSGTKISYPVMKGEKYLYRDFEKESDSSGSIFVENDWTPESICSLLYGHNMWMFKTMFNPLHKFEDGDFFKKNREIKFYVIMDDGMYVEKRTYEITHCILTDSSKWDYASCQYIEIEECLEDFLRECDGKALHKRNTVASGDVIVLSTCSYHISGHNGRLVIVGRCKDRTKQDYLDRQ